MDSVRLLQLSAMRLPRSLSSLETWSFSVSGHTCWIGSATVLHAALGSGAIVVWLPGVIVSILLNLQVQRLGRHWPDMSGGTPNYAARLLKNFPGLDRYVALGYFVGWAAAPAVYTLILTDMLAANLEPLGITCPQTILKIGFICLFFIVGFSGTRALGILHLFFVIPAIVVLLAFCLQGVGWLAFSTTSPGLFPAHWPSFSFREWAKWFFIATYSVYPCETASSFVADSRRPEKTLRFLSFAAWLIPPVFLGGSWVLMQAPQAMGDQLYLNLLAAANERNRKVFSGRRLSATNEEAVSQGCLVWGDLSQVVMVTGTGFLVSIMGIHLGLWLGRGRLEVRWPWWSLCFFVVEAVVLVVGGLAWSWQNLVIGLLFPIVILAADAAVRRISFAPFHPKWWRECYHVQSEHKLQDFVVLQVIILILLICSSATIGWVISGKLDRTSGGESAAVLIVLLVTLSFVGVAIACWTTWSQIAAIDEARQEAKNLFITTLDTVPDTVLVLHPGSNWASPE